MNEEQKLEIVENGEFKNIHLKPKLNKGIKGIEDGNYVIVEKVFAEGYEKVMKEGTPDEYKFYNCKVKYQEEEASFLLYENEHKFFAEQGGIGDKVKITLNKVAKINPKTNVEVLVPTLTFEKVE